MIYLFPECWKRCASVVSEAIYAKGEADEAVDAAIDYVRSGSRQDRAHTLEELYDTIHATETAMRVMGATPLERFRAWRHVIQKNARRGYYGKPFVTVRRK